MGSQSGKYSGDLANLDIGGIGWKRLLWQPNKDGWGHLLGLRDMKNKICKINISLNVDEINIIDFKDESDDIDWLIDGAVETLLLYKTKTQAVPKI